MEWDMRRTPASVKDAARKNILMGLDVELKGKATSGTNAEVARRRLREIEGDDSEKAREERAFIEDLIARRGW